MTGAEWFFPVFVVFWLAMCAITSLLGGWHRLAERFRSTEPLEGERYRFRSVQIVRGIVPFNYGGCAFVTVAPQAFSLSILLVFRFMHPRLVIPMSEVARCEPLERRLMSRVAVHLHGFDRRLIFWGAPGSRILDAWTRSRAR